MFLARLAYTLDCLLASNNRRGMYEARMKERKISLCFVVALHGGRFTRNS